MASHSLGNAMHFLSKLYNPFLFLQAHCLKATALSEAGQNDEALQEYFMCIALKPDWTKVKLEAQKVSEAPLRIKKNASNFFFS